MIKKTDPLKDRKKGNYDYTGQDRRKRFIQNMKKKGYKKKEIWLHKDDWPEALIFLEKIKKKREE